MLCSLRNVGFANHHNTPFSPSFSFYVINTLSSTVFFIYVLLVCLLGWTVRAVFVSAVLAELKQFWAYIRCKVGVLYRGVGKTSLKLFAWKIYKNK